MGDGGSGRQQAKTRAKPTEMCLVVTKREDKKSENFPAFILPPRKESSRAPKHPPRSAVVGPALAGGEPRRAAVQIRLQVRPIPLPLLQVLGGKFGIL